MSKGAQPKEAIESFPIHKTNVDDIEIEYKDLKNKSTSDEEGKNRIPLLFVPGLRVTMDM
jgi:hypothetical protein